MANTAVKDVSSLFLNRTVPAAGKAAGGGDFQKVWNRQLNKGLSDSAAGDSNSQKQNKISEKKNDGFQEKAPVKENDAVCGFIPGERSGRNCFGRQGYSGVWGRTDNRIGSRGI